jgi:hypothetical protein
MLGASLEGMAELVHNSKATESAVIVERRGLMIDEYDWLKPCKEMMYACDWLK